MRLAKLLPTSVRTGRSDQRASLAVVPALYGLVYAAYKAAGLGYPNWSRLNAALYFVDTQRVPLSQLIPGDLLFYSYDGSVQNIHHITIYAGNGKMWEANSTKAGLKFSDMYSIKGLMPSGGRV